MRRAVPALVAVILAFVIGCGSVPRATGSDASGSRTTSSPGPSSSPTMMFNTTFATGDCVGPPSTSPNATQKVARGIDWTVPPGWSDQTSEVTGVAALIRIQAPASYGTAAVVFEVDAVPGPRRSSSAHAQATEDASSFASAPQTQVNDCAIGGEGGAFYQYQDPGGNDIYRLLVLHCPSNQYPALYAITISSHGTIDHQAAADVRGILGSWNWGSNVCSLYQ
jgi:hypothetical protein